MIAVSFVLSGLLLWAKLVATPAWTTQLVANQRLLMHRRYFNNEQSRLLQYLVPEAIRRVTGVSIPRAYEIQRFAFVGAALCVSYVYFRRWLPVAESAIGVLVIVALMLASFQNDLQESAPLLQLLFVVGLYLLVVRTRPLTFAVLLFVAVLVNETAAVLGISYLVVTLRGSPGRWQRALVQSIAVGAPAAVALGIVRYVNRDRPQLGGGWHLPDNLHGIASTFLGGPAAWVDRTYLYWIFFTVPFLIVALARWRDVPRELRLSMALLPVFFLGNLVTGIIAESRQMIPVLPLLIAASFTALFAKDAVPQA